MSADDLGRALAFLERADHAAARVEETALGRLFLTPELPRRWDSNYLLVRADADPNTLAEQAEPLFEAAGLTHRKLSVPDEKLGARLWTTLPREWMRQRLLVMARRRPPEREPDLSLVTEVDEARLRPARAGMIATYPWGRDPEVQRQLLDAKLLAARSVETRFFAAIVGDEPVSWADLYLADGVAQVEDVATLEAHRNRGLASAVVAAAVRAAEEEGPELIFLVADEDDWPKELYVRLGFDAIGRVHDFVRPDAATSAGLA
jgi:ribosomal protein S18 acetylase RimI-like enzyme